MLEQCVSRERVSQLALSRPDLLEQRSGLRPKCPIANETSCIGSGRRKRPTAALAADPTPPPVARHGGKGFGIDAFADTTEKAHARAASGTPLEGSPQRDVARQSDLDSRWVRPKGRR